MPTEYYEADFDSQTFTCANCRWTGKGSDALLIDFYGVSDTQEIHCPNCDELLGAVRKEDIQDEKDSEENIQLD